MSGLNFDLPIWMLALCLLGGVVYAAALYFKNKNFEDRASWLKSLLAFLRFSLVSILLSLLLNPFLQSFNTEVKDPIVAIVEDNSQSIGSWIASNKNQYASNIESLISGLSEKFQIESYVLGASISEKSDNDTLTYDEELTNLSNLESLIDQYEGENLAAVILATDGIFNQGRSPIYAGLPKQVPIYSIALGDTSKRRDALIKNVYHNNIAYLNDATNVQVDLVADNCQGSRAKVVLERKVGKEFQKIKEEDVSISDNSFFKTLYFDINLTSSGLEQFRVRIRGIGDEVVYANNTKNFFIEVLDARQKIRILAHSPHPDISALKTFLSENENYEVKIEFMGDSPSPNQTADVVIFHGLPSREFSIDPFLTQMKRRRTPRVFIVSKSAEMDAFNRAQEVISISGGNGNISEVQAIVNDDFSTFLLTDNLKSHVANFPPLLAPFGEYKIGTNTSVLMKQKIGSIDTDYPLIIYQNKGGIRSTVIAAEGMWKWKLFDYLERQNFDVVKEIINKSITYVSVKEDKRKFRVTAQDKIVNENQDVIFTAELYNDNYELVTDTDVFFTLTDEDGNELNNTFTKKDNYFSLNIGSLTPGTYIYRGNCMYNGSEYKESGKITVQEIQYELYNLEANHSLLYALSEKHGGEVYPWASASNISNDLIQDEGIKPVLYQYAQNKAVIDYKWIFYLLLGFLGLEWFLRRYNGSL